MTINEQCGTIRSMVSETDIPVIETPGRTLPPILLRVREVASLLRISESQVYELINRGVLPVWRHGRMTRVPYQQLMQQIESQVHGQATRTR